MHPGFEEVFNEKERLELKNFVGGEGGRGSKTMTQFKAHFRSSRLLLQTWRSSSQRRGWGSSRSSMPCCAA
eukprot:2935113-Lingulodinium_polyedra.AAC.1